MKKNDTGRPTRACQNNTMKTLDDVQEMSDAPTIILLALMLITLFIMNEIEIHRYR